MINNNNNKYFSQTWFGRSLFSKYFSNSNLQVLLDLWSLFNFVSERFKKKELWSVLIFRLSECSKSMIGLFVYLHAFSIQTRNPCQTVHKSLHYGPASVQYSTQNIKMHISIYPSSVVYDNAGTWCPMSSKALTRLFSINHLVENSWFSQWRWFQQ